jgi:HlyD family secretion protein
MKKTLLAASIGALVLGGAVLALSGKDSSASQQKKLAVPSMTVDLVSPEVSSFARAIAATGTVGARDELLIGSDANGVRLIEVLVDVGSTVQKGQLLARADDSQLVAQLAQQVALVKQAEADNLQAQANRERAERLTDFFSVETVQTRRSSAAAAAAKLELAIAQRDELRIKVAHTRIVAPASGVVSRRTATVGAVVQSGAELFRVIRDGELEWRAELPSHSLAKVRAGDLVRIALDDGGSLEARVRLVAPTIDAATRNGMVYVALPQGAALRSGGHARGEILVDHAQALALPERAVLARDGYSFVYVVGADRIARQTRIETGTRHNGLVEVAGLPAGTQVVGTGAGFVKDGDLVRIAPARLAQGR